MFGPRESSTSSTVETMQQRASVELDWETHTGTYAGDCNEDGNEADGRSLLGDAIELWIPLRSVRMPNKV